MSPRAARPRPADHELLFAHFRKIRGENGDRSYPEIAVAMQLSKKSKGRVSKLLKGRALPTDVEQAQAFVKALGGSAEDAAKAASLLPAARASFKNSRTAEPQSCSGPPADSRASNGIWDVLRRHADPTQVAAIAELAPPPVATPDLAAASESATPGLELAAAEHAERLLDLVARLLGQDLDRLSGPEAALLIVAAYQHADTAGDAHPHRPATNRVTWYGVRMRDATQALCRSFGLPTHELRGEMFDPIPGLPADLRFCAVLLRIAEQLDVHDNRSPADVRQHLRPGSEPAKAYSGRFKVGGLSFARERTAGYSIALSAEPDHPAAEYELRRYLDEVDGILLQCRALQHQFQAGWQRFALPGRLSRDQIEPKDYKYGEFRFELDRAAVLELFMGEQLYDEPYVFVRELLQNAFDAVRLRRFLHGTDERDRVAVTCWQDDSGYLWVRVDDDGIGMDEYTLLNFFLRVGRSYYRSPELQAELLRRGKAGEQFRPISRFGIGVLSCFIVADQVEVGTRRRYPDDSLATPLRLSLHRDEDFFVLREEGMPVDPMPGTTEEDRAVYRNRCGTSLAVRVDPLRARITVDGVAEALLRYVFCPPVPVTFNAAPIDLITEKLVQRPWVPVPRMVDVAIADRQFSANSDHLPYLGPLRIALVPLDLTRYSATPMLRGQLLTCHIAADLARGELGERADLLAGIQFPADDRALTEARALLSTAVLRWTCEVTWSLPWLWGADRSGGVSVEVSRQVDVHAVNGAIELLEQAGHRPLERSSAGGIMPAGGLLRSLLELVPRNSPPPVDGYRAVSRFQVRWAVLRGPGSPESLLGTARWCGHNGIAVPNELTERDRYRTAAGSFSLAPQVPNLCGTVALTDALRPDVSIARDEVRGVPFAVHSALQLAVRRAAAAHDGGPFANLLAKIRVHDLLEISPTERFSASALQDDLVTGGAWDAEPVISARNGLRDELLSVDQIRGRVASGTPVELWPLRCGAEWIQTHDGRDSFDVPFAFSKLIASAVAHERLNLAASLSVRPVNEEAEWWEDLPECLTVVDDRLPYWRSEIGAFPPVTFLRCQEPTDCFRHSSGVWNIDHPVVGWLLDHVEVLERELPVCYNQLRTVLAAEDGGDDTAALRELLEHIARFRPDLTPPLDRSPASAGPADSKTGA